MENEDIFKQDIKGLAGGILICDFIDGEKFIFLGKSNIPYKNKFYESFGGRYEKTDISSLHTAIRELVEEFFNLRININDLNNLTYNIKKGNIILSQYQDNGMSYLIDFYGLNFIFQQLCLIYSQLQKYNNDNNFDYIKYIKERIVTDKSSNGLNEIQYIELFKISDIKNNKINLGLFTKKIINIMIDH